VDALYDAVRAGLGIAVMPSWFCTNALADGSFVRFFSEYQLPTLAMHAVTLAKPPAGGKVHAFVQFAERLLKDG
jgi:DNA-binding transcriptional LysR family regulator